MLLWKEVSPHPKVTDAQAEHQALKCNYLQFSADLRVDWVVLDNKWSKCQQLNKALM